MADELLDELIRELGDGGDNFVLNEIRTDENDEGENFINAQKKKTKATQAHMKTLPNWLWQETREPRAIENIQPDILNKYLSEFFIKICKQDGSEYEPSSIDCIKFSIERYLRDKYYPASIVNDREFHRTREAIN